MTMAWPIDEWLNIKITQEGDGQCMTTVAAKCESKQQKKVAISTPLLAKLWSEGFSTSQPVCKIKTPVQFQDDTALPSISSATLEPPVTQEVFPVIDDSHRTVVHYLPGPSSVQPVPINWYML